MQHTHADARIIARKGNYAVLSTSQELCMRDASLIKLHFVQTSEQPDRFMRALVNDLAGTFIVDVRRLAPVLDRDIRQMPARDEIGLISHELRAKYGTSIALRSAVIENCAQRISNANVDHAKASMCIYGPQGCGKTRHGPALADHFGLQQVLEHDFGPLRAPDRGALVLTCDEGYFTGFHGRRMNFSDAMRSAGLRA